MVKSPVSIHSLLGKVGRLVGLKVGILEGWNVGRSEGSSNEAAAGTLSRRLEGLKVGMLEGWKIGRLKGSSNEGVLSFPKVIIPDRAKRRRREARRA